MSGPASFVNVALEIVFAGAVGSLVHAARVRTRSRGANRFMMVSL
jgi:hypothetical protein